MKINSIQINGFGNLKNKTIDLKEGINLITGDNEAGKSTIAEFIKAMFYGVNKNKSGNLFSDLERFKPWGEAEFSGKIDYELENKKFTAVREFQKNNCKVFDESGNDITNEFNKNKARGTTLGFEQFGIDEDTFINTVFISQKNVVVDGAGQRTVTQKITNMIQSGDESISYDKTKQKLQKKLLDDVGTERSHNKPLNTVMREIGLLEDNKTTLIKNRDRQKEIHSLISSLSEKEQKANSDLDKASKVLEIKDRYATLLKERENDHEIQVKIIEKDHQNKVDERKKKKKRFIFLIGILSVLISTCLIVFKFNLASIFISILGLLFLALADKILSKEVPMPTLPNFDVVKEDFKKKEEKELYYLKKDGIGEGLTSRKLADVKELINGLKKKKEDIVLERHKLNIEAESLKENVDRLNEIEERLEFLYEQEEDLRKLEYSLKLSIEKLTESYEDLKATVVPKLEGMVKEAIIDTTNHNYSNVYYTDESGIMVQNSLGDIVPIDKLSTGTIEQAYLGFRLAIGEELKELPIILDETFAYFDDTRLENVLKLLKEKYSNRQVIILSCSNREKEALEKLKIKFNLINV